MASKYSTYIAISVATVGGVAVLGYYLYKRTHNRNKPPKIWEPVGTIAKIYMYPLKGGRRVELQQTNCTKYGLQASDQSLSVFRDRCLVIYKESTHDIQVGTNLPKMLLIEVEAVDDKHFCLRAPGMESINFKLPELSAEKRHVRMYQAEKMLTIDCGDEVAEWVSNYIFSEPVGLRLGFHDGAHKRDIEKYNPKEAKLYPLFKNSAAGLYSGVTSLHLLTTDSVDDLRKRIPNSSVTINNFRPNIVIEGENIEPCALTTIDPDTAKSSKDYEPIKTMRRYRPMKRFGSGSPSPVMGILACLHNEGLIKLGDNVYVGKY
ncbi:hypothetical protein RI129_007916 [Pyrocoelia pectoralis]|uniref:Molybdenum cofactor sulfurase middle domain-containing protein n=1 Tax=Pyrocoelia pectoralis TaxID=417401 RepID=A0AAN7VFC7_9COLE